MPALLYTRTDTIHISEMITTRVAVITGLACRVYIYTSVARNQNSLGADIV